MEFAKRLKMLRIAKGLKQADLSNILGCTQSTIANYENGRKKPNDDTLKQFSIIFNVPLEYLRGEDLTISDEMLADGYTPETVIDDMIGQLVRLKIKTEQDQKILTLFHNLSDEGKRFFIHLLESYNSSQNM